MGSPHKVGKPRTCGRPLLKLAGDQPNPTTGRPPYSFKPALADKPSQSLQCFSSLSLACWVLLRSWGCDDSCAERALPYGRRPGQPSSSSLAGKVRVQFWWMAVVLLFSLIANASYRVVRRRLWLYRAVVSHLHPRGLPFSRKLSSVMQAVCAPGTPAARRHPFFTTATRQNLWFRVFAREELDQNPLTSDARTRNLDSVERTVDVFPQLFWGLSDKSGSPNKCV